MIDHLKLKFGSSIGASNLEFDVTPITVFVGPNYSGKSLLIREILRAAQQGGAHHESLILEEVRFRPFSLAQAREAIEQVRMPPQPGETTQLGNVIVGHYGSRNSVPEEAFLEALQNFGSAERTSHFRSQAGQWFLQFRTRLLDGQSRMGLASDQSFGDLQQPPQSSFQQIFRDDDLRTKLRETVFQAFGLHLVFDPTQAGMIRLRLSSVPPSSLEEEQSLTQQAAKFHAGAVLISQASDGVKAFCGILTEVLAGSPDILLLDEPEAFLHPALSFQLGQEIARDLQSANKRLFVSTHSPQFLMGCVSSGVAVNVVRLTYRDGAATARLLPSEELATIMRNPLLRSAGVLSALFFENVVMTEGDTDRAFYQEINERLLQFAPDRAIPNCLFINGNGKDAIPVIAEPLRRLGIPVATIYDVDFVKDGGAPSTKRLNAAGIPTGLQASLNSARSAVKSYLESANSSYKRSGGITLLSGEELATAEAYLSQLAEFGLFVVPGGEVESWLRSLGITGHAAAWLIPMFERMGDDPTAESYVKPEDGDAWQFVNRIRDWLLLPTRKGMPA